VTYPQLLSNLKKGRIEPFYIIQTSDNYLIREAIKGIKGVFLKEKEDIFNYHIFSGKETNSAAILNTVRTLPFSSERRLVIVEEVEKLKISEREKLFSYLANPVPFTTLFLFIKGGAGKQDKKKIKIPSVNLIRLKKWDFAQTTTKINPFDLTRWLERKNLPKTFEMLKTLLAKESDFPKILGMLAWWLRQKAKSKGIIDKKLLEEFNELRTMELAIKRGKFSPRLGLELLLIRLAQQ